MVYKRNHSDLSRTDMGKGFSSKRYFWWFFKRKKRGSARLRPGAMMPETVKKVVQEYGIGSQVEILRIGFDGELDDMPIIVEIIGISDSGFTGRIVNLERQMIESSTEKLVYAKQGGGIIDFRFDDGDIKDITLSQDAELLQQERNVDALKEVLNALEPGDAIIISYYDSKKRGTLNAEGTILSKSEGGSNFRLKIEKINKIELENKVEKEFDVQKDLVIDIDMV